MRLIALALFALSVAAAYSTAVTVTNPAQVGGTGAVRVSKYSIGVVRASIEVSAGRITGIAIDVASSTPGYYNIYAEVTSGACSTTASWMNVYLTSTPTALSSSLSPQCVYAAPGAAVEVRGVPA